ncbi:MAG TPA: Asp-tRNA(Asn)/Glu-tRNA(Gln) amidotransferase subunit GatA [Candidatus Marinimicrobia bacterium]|nr:Asp-tRNA(Asn)/Glu-tRNA(Gln) amidotransferase subunit GatA [Candidatus Neomarinimicrobiota bacterium]HRS51852.1 Asp-tRNA(Asn)/Glu-tRNA(Gln) amidotransferase subunit GatA [Candidatus Neomarinimicrobiota bacterium]HRU92687.1 Asp-tRNA(Asn)/Glu-tRNA(Gln) amidotransferase subunit GatA [Candidatus Neomarinimicrobiota bacterium]
MTGSVFQLGIEQLLERVNSNPHNAFISVVSDIAGKYDEINSRIRSDQAGSLAGYTIGIKDNICMAGLPTTCASRILANFTPPYEATVVTKIRQADGLIVGKTNMDEFAMGSTTEFSAFGLVTNPHNEKRVPGGSSGGSAAAVAGNLVDIALGSDTGGSIRQPAAFCGIVGLKPTYGRVSRYGLVAFASSLDQIGTFSRNVADSARLLQVIAGHDENDSTSADEPVPDYMNALDRDIHDLRIGVPTEYFSKGLDPEIADRVKKCIRFLEKSGVVVTDITLPHTPYAIATYYIIATAEASSNLARYDGVRYGLSRRGGDLDALYRETRHTGFGAEVTRRIMLGTFVLSAGYYEAYYDKAQRVRRLIKEDFMKAFKKVDAILTPTTPTTAYEIGAKIDDPLAMYLGDIYTVPANLAGVPALNFPLGKSSEGLPIGAQLTGRYFDEETILRIAHYIERNYEE